MAKSKSIAKPLTRKPAKVPGADPEGPKVFISWSGARSKPAAEAFRNWLAEKVGRSQPWTSSVDIPLLGSSAWRGQILEALESSRICVSFLTTDNRKAPWLHFEAGAVAQRMRDRETTIALVLLDLEPGEVEEPLVAYQLTVFTREALSKLVGEINAQVGDASYSASVKDSFEKDWPELEKKMRPPPLAHDGQIRKRGTDEILAEVLQKVRTIEHAVTEVAKSRDLVGIDNIFKPTHPFRLPTQEGYAQLLEQLHGKVDTSMSEEAAWIVARDEDSRKSRATREAQLAQARRAIEARQHEVAAAGLAPLTTNPSGGKTG